MVATPTQASTPCSWATTQTTRSPKCPTKRATSFCCTSTISLEDCRWRSSSARMSTITWHRASTPSINRERWLGLLKMAAITTAHRRSISCSERLTGTPGSTQLARTHPALWTSQRRIPWRRNNSPRLMSRCKETHRQATTNSTSIGTPTFKLCSMTSCKPSAPLGVWPNKCCKRLTTTWTALIQRTQKSRCVGILPA